MISMGVSNIDEYDMPPLKTLDPVGMNQLMSGILQKSIDDVVAGFLVYLEFGKKTVNLSGVQKMISDIERLLPKVRKADLTDEAKKRYNYLAARANRVRHMEDAVKFFDSDWCQLMIGANDRPLALMNAAEHANRLIICKAERKLRQKPNENLTLKTRKEWSNDGYTVAMREVPVTLKQFYVQDRDTILIQSKNFYTNHQAKKRRDK